MASYMHDFPHPFGPATTIMSPKFGSSTSVIALKFDILSPVIFIFGARIQGAIRISRNAPAESTRAVRHAFPFSIFLPLDQREGPRATDSGPAWLRLESHAPAPLARGPGPRCQVALRVTWYALLNPFSPQGPQRQLSGIAE